MEVREKILIAVIILSVLILIVVVGNSLGIFKSGEVSVFTDKQDYRAKETLRVQIENNSDDFFCFSSCYPYYIEKRNGEASWESYSYDNCSADDLSEKCLSPKETKAFQFTLPFLEKGIHRLSIPVCFSCGFKKPFEREQWLYSNEFIVK